MGKQDMPKMQTYALKVNIHCVCDGCKDKVKKLIQKTEGVYQTNVDAEQGKVVVSGVVDPDKLIKKLKKSGKHAELWGGQKVNLANGQNFPGDQFNSFGNGKGGKDNKPQQQKGGQGQQKGVHFEPLQMKGAKEIKMPSKDQKSVKFQLPEEFDGSEDDFDGSEAYDDEFDDESDGDFEDDESEFGHGQHTANKAMPMMGNGHGSKGGPTFGMINGHGHGHPMNASKNGDAKDAGMNFKKGGATDFPFEMKGNVGKHHGKDGKGGKKGGKDVDGGGEKNKKGGGGGRNKNGGAKKVGGGLLGFLGFGKKSKKGEAVTKKNNKSNIVEPVASLAGHHKVKKGKNGGGDFADFPDMGAMMHKTKGGGGGGNDGGNGGGNGGKGGNSGGGGGGGKVGQMGPSPAQMGVTNNYPMSQMGKMGNFPVDQARGFSAVHGLPAPAAMNGGGYNYQGQAIQAQPSYQQFMPMMMNPQQQQQQHHQAAHGNGMYHPAMYGNHHPSMNYMPPPPMPSHPMNDPMTHIFSDENTESCSIM